VGGSLKWPFKRPKTKDFLVYLGKRGNRRLLGKISLSDEDDIVLKVQEYITKRCEELKVKPEEYPRIHIVETETGKELKFENPFWEAPEPSEGSSGGVGLDPKNLSELINTALGLQGSLYKAVFDGVSEGLKNIVSSSLSLAQDLVNTVRAKTTQSLGGQGLTNMSVDDLIKLALISGIAKQGGVLNVGGQTEGSTG
jgi:hypothetical protein